MGAQVGILSGCQFASLDGLAYSNQGRNLKTWWDFEDFIGGSTAGVVCGLWSPSWVGAGSNLVDDVGTAARPGILTGQTGTTATGNVALNASTSARAPFLFGAGIYTFETDINVPILSTVAEEYILRIGFGDSITGGDMTDGVYFEYDRLGSGTNWFACTSNNSARTKTDTGYAVSIGWQRLKIFVSPALLASFYFNQYNANNIATNVPSGAGRGLTAVFDMIKSAGLTTRTFSIDWVWLHFDLTASR